MSTLFIFRENIVAELLDSSNSWEVQAVSNLLHVYFITGFLPINSIEECSRVFLFFEHKGGWLCLGRLDYHTFSLICHALHSTCYLSPQKLALPPSPNSLLHWPSCIQVEIILNPFLTHFLCCHFHIYNYSFTKG